MILQATTERPHRGPRLRSLWLALIAFGLAVSLVSLAVRAADSGGFREETYRGLYLRVMPANPDTKFDIRVVGSDKALEIMCSAIDLIYEHSPFNAKTLNLLKSRGDVVIIYDPGFPKRSLSSLTLAAFLPKFFEPAHGAPGETVFVAVLGRYIIKHEPAEIAAEGIVHELVGHGVQHMHGRLENGNSLNIECEASLFELLAFLDLGVDMFSGYMVRFRREVEAHHCDDFKRFMRKHKSGLMPLWDQADLDVIRILSIFDEYLAQLPK